jgi:hypothetical protein
VSRQHIVQQFDCLNEVQVLNASNWASPTPQDILRKLSLHMLAS